VDVETRWKSFELIVRGVSLVLRDHNDAKLFGAIFLRNFASYLVVKCHSFSPLWGCGP
jgi:hypothetical protein